MMTSAPVDPGVDLGQLPWFPILRRRLFRSEFHLKATDAEWRAGMTIWLRSMDQQPSGSLPNDDKQLQSLAGLARQRAKWQRVKAMALHGWYVCDDGRLYHDTVAEVINGFILRTKLSRTRQEPRLKSTANFPESKVRDSPPKSPPRNGGDLLAWNGVKQAVEPETWPKWLEEIYGPEPEGPIKRRAALASQGR